MTVPTPQWVAERGGVRFVRVPHCQPSCGDIISDPRVSFTLRSRNKL